MGFMYSLWEKTLVTKSYCEECRISENNYKKTRWKVRYREAKSQGKCTICFYNLPRTDMATCIECSQENKKYHEKLKAQGKNASQKVDEHQETIHLFYFHNTPRPLEISMIFLSMMCLKKWNS
jgi:hypothetical protein